MPMFDFPRHKMFPNHLLQASTLFINAETKTIFRTGPLAGNPEEVCRQEFELPGEVIVENGTMLAPLEFVAGLDCQVEREGSDTIVVSHNAYVLKLRVGECVKDGGLPVSEREGVVYVPVADVLDLLKRDFLLDEDGRSIQAIVHDRVGYARPLTEVERKKPYSKFFDEYWQTPYHLRPDVVAWSKKQHLFHEYAMQPPEKMIHVSEINRLMDREYRENEWTEGWTLFDDGTAVCCVKTHFDDADHHAFAWYFAWLELESLRYMIWYPPAHYGIDCTLETRLIVTDPNKSLWEKTHGGNILHFVQETAFITSLCYDQSFQKYPADLIGFVDMEYRGFTPENVSRFEEEGLFAVSGGDAMLHFFADDADGKGGTLYTHFWFGQHRDPETGRWGGDPGVGKRMELIVPCMVIGNHGVHEFASLASILGRLYREEGGKPIA
jgi:hypothetical protein